MFRETMPVLTSDELDAAGDAARESFCCAAEQNPEEMLETLGTFETCDKLVEASRRPKNIGSVTLQAAGLFLEQAYDLHVDPDKQTVHRIRQALEQKHKKGVDLTPDARRLLRLIVYTGELLAYRNFIQERSLPVFAPKLFPPEAQEDLPKTA